MKLFKPETPFPNSEFYEIGDYKLHYRIDPAKTVTPSAKAFLIHGFACDTSFYDEIVEKLTADGISCLRVDLPNFGFSTREYGGINYISPIEIVQKMMKEFDEDGTGWILFGHSMGGSVALQLAIDEGRSTEKEISSVVLYAPLLMRVSSPMQQKLLTKRPIGALFDLEMSLASKFDFIWNLMEYFMTFDRKYSKNMPTSIFLNSIGAKHAGRGIAFLTATSAKPDINEIHKIETPLQLILGGRDVFVTPFTATKLWRKMPKGADKHFFPSGGHFFPMHLSDRTWETTKTFLQKTKQI